MIFFNLISDSFTCCDNLSGSCKLSCENVSIIYGSTNKLKKKLISIADYKLNACGFGAVGVN